MDGIWNVDFTKNLPDGTAGNQAYFGLFFKNDYGRYQRMTQAEGNEISKNPEKKTVNKIAQTSPEDVVTGYREEFSKDFEITKGDPEFEFFDEYSRLRPTGKNARIPVLMVDMMKPEKIPNSKHMRYLAYAYDATVTVDTANYTDGKLTVSFIQANEPVLGIAQLIDEDGEFPEFTPSTDINIESIILKQDGVPLEDDASVTVKKGKELWLRVAFLPLGCPHDFEVKSDDLAVCKAERKRQTVIITGVGAGTTTITVTSTSDPLAEAAVEVTVI
jgi:hypothetical protein